MPTPPDHPDDRLPSTALGRPPHLGAEPAQPTPSIKPESSQVDLHARVTISIPDGPAAEYHTLAEGDRVGHFVIRRLIARGGMGVVYEAHDPHLNRDLALKLLPVIPVMNEGQALARFGREARAAAQLSHRHVVPVYECGSAGGRPYIAMMLVSGGSLASRMAEYRGDFRKSAELVMKVARAVQHAHEKGVVHRDLKPSNVLIDADGEPLVADFGLAKLTDDESGLTFSGQLMGTPAYMAPEQAGGRTAEVGPRSDVWALGVILYECLAGRRPFLEERGGVLHQVLTVEPPRPRGVPAALARVCRRCLEKEPARRYGSAGELADELGRWLDGKRVDSESVPTIVWRRAQRRPVATGALMAAVLALAAFVATRAVPTALPQPDAARNAPDRVRARAGLLLGDPAREAGFVWALPPGARPVPACQSGQLTIHAPNTRAALQLAKAPETGQFRFEVKFRSNDLLTGRVGLFVGGQGREAPAERDYFALRAALGRAPGGLGRGAAAYFHACHYRTPAFGKDFSAHDVLVASSSRLATDPMPAVRKHSLGVDVWSGRIRAWWGTFLFADIGEAEARTVLTEAQAQQRPVPNASPGSFDLRGGVGLFVENGSATFSDVKLTPLNSGSEL